MVYLLSRKSVTTVLISDLRSERDMPNLVSRPWRTDFMETSSMLASVSMALMASASSPAVGGWRAGTAAGAGAGGAGAGAGVGAAGAAGGGAACGIVSFASTLTEPAVMMSSRKQSGGRCPRPTRSGACAPLAARRWRGDPA